MLRSLRDYFPKWLITAFLSLIALLIIGGSLYGPLRYQSAAANQVVAKVNKRKIKRIHWQSAYEQIMLMDRVDQSRLTTEEKQRLQRQVLEQLIVETVLQQWFDAKGYRAHPRAVIDYIKRHPVLKQHLAKEQRLARGYSKANFLKQIADYRVSNQCYEALIRSAFVLPQEIQKTVRLTHQKRDFSYLELKVEHFTPSAENLPPEELQAYYSQALSEFRTPERVSLEYIVLDRSCVLAQFKTHYPNDAKLVKEKLASTFQEKVERLAQLTRKHVHSLSEAALELNLTVQSTGLFERTGGSTPITKHPDVIDAAFSQAVREGFNSSIIRLDAERVVVLRVKQYEPLRLASFEAVQDEVRKQLSIAKAKEAARRCGEQCVAALTENPTAMLDIPKSSQWRKVEKIQPNSSHIPSVILNAAFTISPKEKARGVLLPSGGYAVIQLSKIRYGQLSQLMDKEHELVRDGLTSEMGGLDYQCYVEASKREANIVYSFS